MGGSFGRGEDCPAVVVPVDYQVGVAEVGGEAGDGEGGDGGGVLDQKPGGGGEEVEEEVGEVEDLEDDFDRGE